MLNSNYLHTIRYVRPNNSKKTQPPATQLVFYIHEHSIPKRLLPPLISHPASMLASLLPE
jgi:hypothetical protein